MESTTEPAVAPAQVDLQTSPGGEAVVTVSGEWNTEERPDPAEAVETLKIGKPDGPKKVRFLIGSPEPSENSTPLMAYMAWIAASCSAAEIEFDFSGLPEGPAKLLGLSRAVPVKEEPHINNRREGFFYIIGKVGLSVYDETREVIEFMGSLFLHIVALFKGKRQFRKQDMWQILEECSADALPIVTLISFLVGMIIAFVGGVQLQKFGATIYVVDLVGIAMTRELAAIMTSIIMSGRTGAAFAAAIGTMKVNQEVDALRTTGLSPMSFLVVPRAVALILMMPLMVAYSDFISLLGGWVVSLGLGIPTPLYFQRLGESVDLMNCAIGIIKGAFFGAIVAGSGCLRGLQCGRNAAAVGEAATSAVVTSITGIIILDAVFAVILSALNV